MYFETTRTTQLTPLDPDNWLQDLSVDVYCQSSAGDWPILAGKMSGTYLRLTDAVDAGMRLLDVFDARSSEFLSLYTYLFDLETDEVRSDLDETETLVNDLIYLEQCVFHPELRTLRQFLIDRFCATFQFDALIAIWDTPSFSTIELSDEEYEQLGFRKLEDVDVRVRTNVLQPRYDFTTDEDRADELVVPSSASAYVEREWERLIGG